MVNGAERQAQCLPKSSILWKKRVAAAARWPAAGSAPSFKPMTKPDTENTDKETPRRAKGRPAAQDLDPATSVVEEDDDERLPEPAETMTEDLPAATPGTGREAILRAARLAPARPARR